MTIRASDHLPHDLTEEQYRPLPETAAREIEVVHGHVIIRESPMPEHNRVARRLAGSMEELPSTEPWIRVETDIDVVPLADTEVHVPATGRDGVPLPARTWSETGSR
ncbi:hypothetical protein [Nocardia beijingensis]